MIRDSGWKGRVVPAYRPDFVVDPDFPGFSANLDKLGEITGEDTGTWKGYLDAHRKRRAYFKSFGATSTDHGHPTAATIGSTKATTSVRQHPFGTGEPAEREMFRGQMLVEMAR